ncbi:uncharacterized protein TNCV_1168202 [Trichonephila clavipes]|uniref:Uncharacterized protein n=1 Tax=Trichonephila clavipes TaxID=2585209 RepID=A0A8X6T2A0_TRICX|nr:uncharacterized protein TNCV_1168202 [Trichonephila clavipes]
MTCSLHARPRAASSPVFHNPSPSSSRPLSPGGKDTFSPPNPIVVRCPHCNQPWTSSLSVPGSQLNLPQAVGSGSMAHTSVGCHPHSNEEHATGSPREVCEAECSAPNPPKHPLSPESSDGRQELKKRKPGSAESKREYCASYQK